MQKVQNIIFDLGGVLLNLNPGLTREAFLQLGVTNIDQLFHNGITESFFRDYEKGTIDDTTFVEDALQLTRPGTTREAVIDAWNKMLLDFPEDRVLLLEGLKEKYRLFLFSNTNALHVQSFGPAFFKRYKRPMAGLFEKVWYSHIIKFRKPDVEAFEFVLQDAGLKPADTLFIDDTLINVEGARKAGLQAIHLVAGKSILDLGL